MFGSISAEVADRVVIASFSASWIYDIPHIYFKSTLHDIVAQTSLTFNNKNNKTKLSWVLIELLPTGILQQLSFEFRAELNPEFNHKKKCLCCVFSCSVGHWGKFAQAHTSEMLTLLPPCKQLSILGGVCRLSQSTRKEISRKCCLIPPWPQLWNKKPSRTLKCFNK